MFRSGRKPSVVGASLVGVLVGLVVLGVAMLALTASIVLMNAATQSTDAERFAAEGRACGELLLALRHEDPDAFQPGQDCPGGVVADPAQWWGGENGENESDALTDLCVSNALELRCENLGNEFRVDLRSADLGQTELTLLIPGVDDDSDNGDDDDEDDDDNGEEECECAWPWPLCWLLCGCCP